MSFFGGYYTILKLIFYFFFFFNDPAPPEIYPLPLPPALPISLLCDAVYLQAGAPSLMAAPTGPASLTKMEHVTRGVVRLLFVIDASPPPPLITSVTRLFPVVGHQLTSPAAGVQATPPTLLVTLVLYLDRKSVV